MSISVVIPCRNSVSTLHACLDPLVLLQEEERVCEIIVVDDGSTDATQEVARTYASVTVLDGGGRGPGSARNVGWKAAQGEYVWFVDSDCIASRETLDLLMAHFSDQRVSGVGGSYSNAYPDNILAWLIHEEIVERHADMPTETCYLAGYNVVYTREALEAVGGFDEGMLNGPGAPGAEDIDLALRIAEKGYRLCFERTSTVVHHHPRSLCRYLRSQYIHGYWRAFFHAAHRHTAKGDAYSSIIDHVQPVVALAVLGACCLSPWALLMRQLYFLGFFVLLALQLPMSIRLFSRTDTVRSFLFIGLGWIRSFSRGVGLLAGVIALWQKKKGVHG